MREENRERKGGGGGGRVRERESFHLSFSLSSQMFEHSQALHAHQQQRQSHPGHSAPRPLHPGHTSSSSHQPSAQRLVVGQESSNPSTSRQVPLYQRQHSTGGGITQQQLASALASAMGSVDSSPLSSLDFSTVQASR